MCWVCDMPRFASLPASSCLGFKILNVRDVEYEFGNRKSVVCCDVGNLVKGDCITISREVLADQISQEIFDLKTKRSIFLSCPHQELVFVSSRLLDIISELCVLWTELTHSLFSDKHIIQKVVSIEESIQKVKKSAAEALRAGKGPEVLTQIKFGPEQ